MSTAGDVRGAAPREPRETVRARALAHLYPARLEALDSLQMDLIVGRSQGYRVWDLDGRDFLDLDLRGGVYNLGHRNAQITRALRDALETADMGFQLFSGVQQATLAEKLARSSGLDHVVFAPSGTEANDMAIRSARRHTGKRRIVSCEAGYHGAAALSSAAGHPGMASAFHADYPEEFTTVPLNDAQAIADELAKGDVAGVILEPSCNAAGYPETPPPFWRDLRALCDQHGAVLIIDEVVTGLGRSGKAWGFQAVGASPDIIVTGKGLSGGVYPIAAAILSERVAGWLKKDPFGYVGTFAGGELACAVGNAAFDLSTNEETLSHVRETAASFRRGLEEIQTRRPIVAAIRQFGLLFSLEIDRDGAGFTAMGSLFQHGVLTFLATNADNLINLKPGLLVDDAFSAEALQPIEDAISNI